MADGVIEIIIGGNGDGSSSDDSKKKEKKPEDIMVDAISKIAHPMKSAQSEIKNILNSAGGAKAVVGLGAMHFVSNMSSTALRYAKMELNRSFSLKENYLAQNKVAAFESEMGAIKNIAGTIASNVGAGAALGAKGGPVGVAIGAVFGAVYGTVTSVMNIQTQKAETMERHNMQLNATNAQTTFSASRASLVNGGRGTEY